MEVTSLWPGGSLSEATLGSPAPWGFRWPGGREEPPPTSQVLARAPGTVTPSPGFNLTVVVCVFLRSDFSWG